MDIDFIGFSENKSQYLSPSINIGGAKYYNPSAFLYNEADEFEELQHFGVYCAGKSKISLVNNGEVFGQSLINLNSMDLYGGVDTMDVTGFNYTGLPLEDNYRYISSIINLDSNSVAGLGMPEGGLPLRFQKVHFYAQRADGGESKECYAYFLVSDPIISENSENELQEISGSLRNDKQLKWNNPTWLEDIQLASENDQDPSNQSDAIQTAINGKYQQRYIMGGGAGRAAFNGVVYVYGRKYTNMNSTPSKPYIKVNLINGIPEQDSGPMPNPMPANEEWYVKDEESGSIRIVNM